MTKRWAGATGLAAIFAGATVIALVASAQGGDTGRSPATPSLDAARPAEFAALRAERTAEDALPGSLASQLSGPGARGRQLFPSLSRKAITTGATTVYLVPSNQGVCALTTASTHEGSGVSCATSDDVDTGMLGPSYLYVGCEKSDAEKDPECRALELFGLAPDGITRVVARLADGSALSAGVTNNAYLISTDAAAKPASLTFQGSGSAAGRMVPLRR
jgi:hypothetical protein